MSEPTVLHEWTEVEAWGRDRYRIVGQRGSVLLEWWDTGDDGDGYWAGGPEFGNLAVTKELLRIAARVRELEAELERRDSGSSETRPLPPGPEGES